MTTPASGGTSWLDQLLGIPGQISTGFDSFTAMFTAMERLGTALMNPETWERIFMVIFGFVLIYGAFKYAG